MILKSTAVKAGAAGTVITGSGATGIYLARDYINYYEVERKVVDEDVVLVADSLNAEKTSLKISTKTDDQKGWNKTGGYYWECTISGDTGINLNKTDFEAMLSSSFLGNVKEIRKNLVYLCSGNRSSANSKQTETSFKFNSEQTKGNWFEFLFGPSTLKQVEREVIGKNLKLTVSFEDSTTKKVKITTPSTVSEGEPKLEESHTWTCEIIKNEDSSADVDNTIKTNLDSHLFKDNQALSSEQKKAKAELVKACSKSRSPDSETTVTGTLKVRKELSDSEFSFVDHPDLNYLLKAKK